MTDYYKLLNVEPSASADEIQAAIKKFVEFGIHAQQTPMQILELKQNSVFVILLKLKRFC